LASPTAVVSVILIVVVVPLMVPPFLFGVLLAVPAAGSTTARITGLLAREGPAHRERDQE
jgi:hypothetical protein